MNYSPVKNALKYAGRNLIFAISLALFSVQNIAAEFSGKLDTSLRFDDRSGKTERYQYRVRVYPQIIFDENKTWSLNAFAVTGDEFSSSHNTLDDGESDLFYVRRLYVRHIQENGKTEIGVIPTYKGRISSTGLSKDGWIAGLRQVLDVDSGRLELVVGDLQDTRASKALETPDDLSYVELEYSSNVTKQTSFEVSADRILRTNFIRGEVRYQYNDELTYAFELIDRLDTNDVKIVLSAETEFQLSGRSVEFFGYYSYVSDEFGPRAELTEDFLSTGHGIALELESSFSDELPLEWFAKFEAFEGNSRIQLGVKYGLDF